MDDSSMINAANYTVVLTRSQHLSIGWFLIFSGFVAGFLSIVNILIHLRFPKLLLTPSAVPELALNFAELAVAGLHPFSGSAAIVNRWIWGPIGCQLYALSGFLFGIFQLLIIPVIAFDRYVLYCESSLIRYRTYKTYAKTVVILFLVTTFWSVAPIIGWSSFALLPHGVVCNLDWTETNAGLVSYFSIFLCTSGAGPIFIGGLCYYLIYHRHRTEPDTSAIINWAPKKKVGRVILGCWLTTYVCYSPFALNIAWSIIYGIRSVPSGVTALPAITSKLSGLFNPIFYTYSNPVHWACVKKLFGSDVDMLNVMMKSDPPARVSRRPRDKDYAMTSRI